MLAYRAELNRINVFPVPDGDTGTNLALTLRAMADAVAGLREKSVARVAGRLAEAGVMSARGNSGMMLSHFFLGFAQGLGPRTRARSVDLAAALQHAAASLYGAVEDPVEGTLLTVVREAAEAVHGAGYQLNDLTGFTHRLLEAASASLARTPELLPRLKEANVVDAGAKGFVRFLEGVVKLIDGPTEAEAAGLAEWIEEAPSREARPTIEVERSSLRYCTALLLRGTPLPERERIAAVVREMGDSLIVTRSMSLAKVHIHTDAPERVERALAGLGLEVERAKVQDMHEQQRRRAVRQRVAVVTDTTCDLPPELLIEHDIHVVPLTVIFGDQTFRDQIDLSHEEFARRLVDPDQPRPTTSQPAPADFQRIYRQAAGHADEVLGIFVSGRLSGTWGQGNGVASRFGEARVRAYDSRTSTLGLGFLTLRAAELAGAGRTLEEIVAELDRLRQRSGLLITLDTLDYLRRSGRVGRAKAYLAGVLNLKPIVSLDREGVLAPVERVRGEESLAVRVEELLAERIPRERRRLRLGVIHVLAPEVARGLAERLEERFRPDELLVRPGTGVLAAHTGPGAWAVAYQAE